MSEVKRNLYGLTPNTRYIIKVRAVNGFGVYSNWSEALVVQTSGDDSIPAAPTNLILDFSGIDLIANWTAPSLNTDGSPFFDFSHYEVTILNGTVPKVFKTVDTPFVYTFSQNQLDWGTPVPHLSIEIRTVDFSGNKSAPLAGSATNPVPADPSAPTVIAGFTFITIIMDLNYLISDLKSYDLYLSTDPVDNFELISSSSNSSYIHEVTDNTTYYYKFKVKDVFNQESNFSPTISSSALIEGTIDDVPPEDWDTGLDGTSGLDEITQEPYVTLTWLPQSTAVDLDHYEIRYTIAGENLFVTDFVSSDFTTYTIKSLINETDYDFQIRAVDFSGNKGTWLPSVPKRITTVAGDLKYDTTATGGLVIQGSGGFIRSGNYIPSTSGWRLNYQGLEINQGTISAPAIQIGISNENLLRNSSFENVPSTIATNWSAIGVGNTYSKEIGAGNFLYQSASQKMVAAAVSQAGISQTISIANGFLKESIPANTWVTISIWIKQGSGSSRNAKISLTDDTNTASYIIPTAVATSTTYQRLVHKVFVTGASSSLTFKAWVDTPAAGATFYFEGAQLQLASYVTSYAPATLEIPDNYIQSAYISSLTADKFASGTISAAQINIDSSGYLQSVNYAATGSPAGYRLTSNSLLFQNGSISIVSHGGFLDLSSSHLYLGNVTGSIFKADSTGVTLSNTILVTSTEIKTTNYSAGTTGWKIAADGSAELNNVTVRGNVQGNSNTIVTGGTFRTGTSGARITITGNTAIDSGAPIMQIYGSAGQLFYNAHQTGIFFGGGDATTAPLYYDVANARTVFKSQSGSGSFAINSEPSNDANKVLKLTVSGTDKFYLKTDGSAFFSGQVSASQFANSNTVGSGSPTTSDLIKSINFTHQTASTKVAIAYPQPGDDTTYSILWVDSVAGFNTSPTAPVTASVGSVVFTYTYVIGNSFRNVQFLDSSAYNRAFPDGMIPVGTSVTDGIGWQIDATGGAEFNSVLVRGNIQGSNIDGSLITGTKFRTSTTGKRIEMGGADAFADDINFYTGSTIEVNAGSINTSTDSYSGNDRGILSLVSPNFRSGAYQSFFLLKGANPGTVETTAEIIAGTILLTMDSTFSTGSVRVGGGPIRVTGTRDATFQNPSTFMGDWGGSGAGLMSRGGSNVVSFDWSGGVLKVFIDTSEQFRFSPSLSKTFVIDHPIDSNKYLVHSTIEGPEAAVYYRGEATLINGLIIVYLPEYFESLTQTKNRTVQLTPIYNGDIRSGRLQATRVVNGQFAVYGDDDISFFWEVKAERKDIPKLEVEPSKSEYKRVGDGPYTYLKKM